MKYLRSEFDMVRGEPLSVVRPASEVSWGSELDQEFGATFWMVSYQHDREFMIFFRENP